MVSKIRISCDTSCIIYTILPFLTVITAVHGNLHISLSYLPFFYFNYANFRGTYRISGDSVVININCYVFKTYCLIQGKKDPVEGND